MSTKKFSEFAPSNNNNPIELVGLQNGVNTRTGLVSPVYRDAQGNIRTNAVVTNSIVSDVGNTINFTPNTGPVERILTTVDLSNISGDLALKANINSPVLTGTPTAPTAAQGNNTQQIATTAHVVAAIAPKANLASPAFTGIPTAPTATQGTNTAQVATTAHVREGLLLKADLASPTFTGIPSAPTAANGTNTTQIATTAFVMANSSSAEGSVSGPPTTTLNHIAQWNNTTGTLLGTGIPVSTFATPAQVDLKANIASPTFTGVPSAPTAAAANSSTQLATTAFVTTADNLKANLVSPAFTGIPTAPTATAGTSTTQLATTAFATAANNLKANVASPTFTGTVTTPALVVTGNAQVGTINSNTVGNAVSGTLTTNATDTTAGRVLRVGAQVAQLGADVASVASVNAKVSPNTTPRFIAVTEAAVTSGFGITTDITLVPSAQGAIIQVVASNAGRTVTWDVRTLPANTTQTWTVWYGNFTANPVLWRFQNDSGSDNLINWSNGAIPTFTGGSAFITFTAINNGSTNVVFAFPSGNNMGEA